MHRVSPEARQDWNLSIRVEFLFRWSIFRFQTSSSCLTKKVQFLFRVWSIQVLTLKIRVFLSLSLFPSVCVCVCVWEREREREREKERERERGIKKELKIWGMIFAGKTFTYAGNGVCACVCVCACVRERGGEKERDIKWERGKHSNNLYPISDWSWWPEIRSHLVQTLKNIFYSSPTMGWEGLSSVTFSGLGLIFVNKTEAC